MAPQLCKAWLLRGSLGWSSAGPSFFWPLSVREEKINGVVHLYLCADTGDWCVWRFGDAFLTYKCVVSCGGGAGPC